MKRLMGSLTSLLLCSCVYDVPLVEKAELPVDSALTGTWQAIPEEGKDEDPSAEMVIFPFSKTEYVVICSPAKKDRMIFRAYPIQVGDLRLVQLEWLQAEKSNRYQVCQYALRDEILTVETLNPKIVDKDIIDSKTLRETLLANRDNPKLFNNPLRYRRIDE